jgi:hypothetical protein
VSHTKEPWVVCGTSRNGCTCGYIFGDNGEAYVAQALTIRNNVDPVASEDAAKDNARRIVACVNAFAGIPDPQAYVAAVEEARAALQAQVDHLEKTFPPYPPGASPMDKTRAALSRLDSAKGGA